jgi:hypothetical protein
MRLFNPAEFYELEGEKSMLNHVMIGSNDIERSKRFYDAVLGTLGQSLKRFLQGSHSLKVQAVGKRPAEKAKGEHCSPFYCLRRRISGSEELPARQSESLWCRPQMQKPPPWLWRFPGCQNGAASIWTRFSYRAPSQYILYLLTLCL